MSDELVVFSLIGQFAVQQKMQVSRKLDFSASCSIYAVEKHVKISIYISDFGLGGCGNKTGVVGENAFTDGL